MRIVTFSNLFPSTVMPMHGLFVAERMRRVVQAGNFDWRVVAPVPEVIWPLRRGLYKHWAQVPARETLYDAEVHHPRFRHWPGLSQRRQADAVANGARRLLAELCSQGDVVIDAHYLWPDGVAAARLAQELGVPFTLTARGSDVNVLAQDAAIADRIADAADRAHACMAVSDALGARFAEVARVDRERVVTVRNGVDLERFQPGDQGAARERLGLPKDRRIVLGVGRLVPGKRFDLAAQAVRGLSDAMLVLVGDGPERARIQEAGGDRVHFLGAQAPDGVALACRAADVFTLPSEREGWPNVVTEALASGLPVVATRVGGMAQILGEQPDPAIGALVEPGDAAGLQRELGKSLELGQRTERVRAFAERYGWSQPIEQLVATFRGASGREVA